MLLWYLTAGAVGAAGVAALCAVWSPAAPAQDAFLAHHPRAERALRQLGPTPADWGPPSRIQRAQRPGVTQWLIMGPLDGEASGEYLGQIVRTGWPARCLEASPMWDSGRGRVRASAWRAGMVTPAWVRPSKDSGRQYLNILPLRPIAQGWAVNILFYSSTLWLAMPGRRMARSAWRRRRGRCGGCGYPRAGAGPCPECGAAG
jgi:hypothetical protein